MKKLLFFLAICAGVAMAQTCPSGLTQVTQTLYSNVATPGASTPTTWAGTVTTRSDNNSDVSSGRDAGTENDWTVTAGAFNACLSPGPYTVTYRPSRGTGRPTNATTQYWSIPSGGGVYSISSVETTSPTTPTLTVALGQLNPALSATSPVTFNSSTGVIACPTCLTSSGTVSSVFTRIGAVTAQTGDYTAAQVTNAVDSTGSYANPAWITSLAWSKLTGLPTFYYQTIARGGTSVTQRPTVNYSTNFTATDNAGSTRTDIDLAGTITSNTSGNSATATALATTPIQCQSGQFATGIAASGNANCGTPASGGGVTSVFTRTGAVVAASGDYTAAQVTNAVDTTASYSNPSWITALTWSKLTGVPTFYYQTVQANNTAQTQRANLNFSTNFSLADSLANNRTTVDLAGTVSANTTGNAATATTATNVAAGANGSIPYQSGAGATAMLAGNTAATDQVVVSTGTGSAAQAPTLKNAPALSAANMTSFPVLNQNTTGNAATATALAATPTQCSGGQFATGIAASGNANCGTPVGSSYYQTLANAGSALIQRGTFNFTSDFSASDNSGASRTDVALAGTIGANTTGNAATATTATTSTNVAGGSLGAIPYQSGAGATAMLAGNTAATDQVLVSAGTGTAAQAPTLKNAPVLSAANMTSFPTLNQNTTGNAATATALATTPVQCSAGKFATGVTASGAANCITLYAVNAQAATYQVLASDFTGYKRIVVAAGTFTITLVNSTSQPANGTSIEVVNYGTGIVTIARSGQSINGGTSSLILPASSATSPSSAFIESDGTNYFASLSGFPATTGCTNQVVTAVNGTAAATCATLTSAYVDTSIAKTANNLSDLASASSARTNLGLGTAATMAGPTGAIVGTTDTQTLTNKTVDGATATEVGYLSGVTSAIQTQLNGKASSTASTTVNGNTCTLGSTCTVSASDLSTGTLPSARLPELTGDIISSAGSAATTLAHIPTAVSMAGYLAANNITAPATPAAGITQIYTDSTSKNFAAKNDAGTVNHGVQTQLASAGVAIRGIADDGSLTTGNFTVDPGANGLAARTALGTSAARTITAGSAKLTVSNGDGVSGDPTVDLGSVACSHLSNGAASCSTDTTNAANISTGTLPAGRLPAFTGDVTTITGSSTTTVTNLPTGVTMGGYLAATAIAAPTTPAAGVARLYVDSTSKNLAVKNDAGVVNHGIQTRTATASNWVRSIADDGSTTVSQPACSDLTGAAASCGTNATELSSGTVAAARGGAGTVNGILKANGSGLVSAATAGTDYAAATNGTNGQALISNGSGGFGTAVTLATVATSGSASDIGSGTLANARLTGSGSTTVNGQTCTLGSSCTITLSAVNAQAATYQVLAVDFSGYKTITVASGTFTITLVASTSQPAAGQYIRVINYGSGVVTIARSGQNINGGTSGLTLQSSSATGPSMAYVVSDGTNYFADLGFSNPMTTAGDTMYAGTTGLPTRLAAGTTSQVMIGGTTPSWGSLPVTALPALSGDVTSSAGSAVTTVSNLPTGVTMGGYLASTAIAAPATPGTGIGRLYVDSTSKNLALKNDAGTINHGIQTRTATASNWIRAIADDGSTTISQPACSDLTGAAASCGTNATELSSGTVAAARMPALTGDVTTSAGSVATTVAKINGGTVPTSATILGTNGSAQPVSVSTTGSGSAVLATSPTITSPSLSSPSLGTTSETQTFTSNGSTVNRLQILTTISSASRVADAGTAATSGVVGIAQATVTAGNSVEVAISGKVLCDFDATAVNAGDYVQISSTVAGKCHDAGSTRPSSGQIIGFALASGSLSTTQVIRLLDAEVLGQGTMATQSASSVAITGGNIDGTVIGNTTTAAGKFTNLTMSGTFTFGDSTTMSTAPAAYTTGFQTVTGTTTLTATYQTHNVKADATSGAVTVTLFTAVGNSGKVVQIKKIDSTANSITVATSSSQTIDGATTLSIVGKNNAYTLISDGSNWQIY